MNSWHPRKSSMTRWWLAAIVPLCGLAAGQARAQSCGIAATGMAFGNYQPLSATAVNTTSMVTVTCFPGLVSVNISYSVQLTSGGSTNIAARRMSGPGGVLNYQIYRDTLMTQIWGDGTGSSFTVTGGYALGLIFPIVTNYTAYGNIPASQTSGVGGYADTVMAIVTY